MANACWRRLLLTGFNRTPIGQRTAVRLPCHRLGRRLTHSDGQSGDSSGGLTFQTGQKLDSLEIDRLFQEDRVQSILKRITGFDVDKIFATRPIFPLRSPKYRFLTEEDLKMEFERAEERGRQKLQMPPVKAPTEDQVEILSKDPELQEYLDCDKFIFVDASPGYANRDRLIVVREKNGLLREANQNERHRMNQIFFTVEKREMETPKMFQEEHLQDVLDRKEYHFVLDRACLQFEPDDHDYIRVTRATYDHISSAGDFDVLRSTRHFGPMAFHLALTKNIDNLLVDCLQRMMDQDAAEVVRLYYIVNPKEDLQFDLNDNDSLKVIKFYLATEAKNKPQLELAVQKYEQLRNRENQMQEEIKRAHGLADH